MLYDVVIVGGGPAGLTSAIYSCRAGYKTVVVEMGAPGGQAATTEIIENYPGFPEGLSGPELMMNFYNQAVRFGCEFMTAQVTGLRNRGTVKTIETNNESLEAKAVIIAAGSWPRELGVQGEREYRGRGVSYCATCDGFFFRNKKVAVIGGGDSAVKEAIFLSNIAEEVFVIHRRDAFRAAKILGDKVQTLPNVKVLWDTVVDEILGENQVQKIKVHNVKTQEKGELTVEGVFLYVGTKPNTEFLDESFVRNPQGYLITNQSLETSVPGVFAAGDCREKRSRQVATAVGDGALVLAALEEYLQNQK
jgi:thioredoxin reductase (NADPH)